MVKKPSAPFTALFSRALSSLNVAIAATASSACSGSSTRLKNRSRRPRMPTETPRRTRPRTRSWTRSSSGPEQMGHVGELAGRLGQRGRVLVVQVQRAEQDGVGPGHPVVGRAHRDHPGPAGAHPDGEALQRPVADLRLRLLDRDVEDDGVAVLVLLAGLLGDQRQRSALGLGDLVDQLVVDQRAGGEDEQVLGRVFDGVGHGAEIAGQIGRSRRPAGEALVAAASPERAIVTGAGSIEATWPYSLPSTVGQPGSEVSARRPGGTLAGSRSGRARRPAGPRGSCHPFVRGRG